MPDFPIVDAHLHLWDPQHFFIPWLANNQLLDQRYALPEYHAQTTGVEVEAMVYVQVDAADAYGLLEAAWVAERASEDPRIRGIVAWAPVDWGDRARAYLDALREVGPLVKGVRRLLQGEPDASICLRPSFVRGVQMLAEYGFSFDICIYHHQLPSVIELARQCPWTNFMLDHIGKPNIKDQIVDPWCAQIEELAELPNVMCKVSGMVTEADHQHWTEADLAPYVAHVLASFGEDRVVFGSDWPVVLMASSFPRWVAALDALTAELSPEARRKLWVENARRFYRL